MLNGQFVSVKSIIAKLFRDLRLKDLDAFTDIIEWCAEALELIHVNPQYTYKSAPICITNYKGELPDDYIGIDVVEYRGYSLKYASNSFGPQDTTKANSYLTPYSYNQAKIENAVFVDPADVNYFPNRDSIKIDGGYIKTSFKEGNILIHYLAMVKDCDGYPMIPDNQSFKEALYWYTTYKYLYPKALNGEINAQFYSDAYEKWQWYCNQAGAEALMPDLLTLENIKRSFISLKPEVQQFDQFYNNLNRSY